MNKKKVGKQSLIVLLGVALILLPGLGYSDIPKQINYQGYLTNQAGVPVNETVAMVFSFYLDATGGSPIWHETQNVTVDKGVYNVSLGEVTPISLPFGLPYYLGVQVGTDPEDDTPPTNDQCGICLSVQERRYRAWSYPQWCVTHHSTRVKRGFSLYHFSR